MSETHNPKRVAGRRAADFVKSGMTIGLGTGSTVFFTLERLAERVREEGLVIRGGVPTSEDTASKAKSMGLPLFDLEQVERLDITIDGADEIDPAFRMIKGGGGALLREKVVASITEQQIVVTGPNKLVERLGTTFRLPVEIVPFALPVVSKQLAKLAEPHLRLADGKTYLTDNGNCILDCHFPEGIADPEALEVQLASLPGVVESGLFIGLAKTLVVGYESGEHKVSRLS